jgi:alkanesulfonate monooxygenase SsuD/methylene tetrahydromethanopterin reductase-like flavin-dependent oxidoreductase (luciferase family)
VLNTIYEEDFLGSRMGSGQGAARITHWMRSLSNQRIIGSPASVIEKIEAIWHEVGGFGTLLVFGFDYKHKPEAWHHSLKLLNQEVLPRLRHLNTNLAKTG